jgi:hypothetical protein
VSNVITTTGFRAAILDSTKMQLVFGVDRRSVVLATLQNMLLAFEIVFFTHIISKVITTSGFRVAILDSNKMQLMFDVGRRSVSLANLHT